MAGINVDMGGNNLIVNDIYTGASAPGQTGTKLDSSLITSLQQPGQITIKMTGLNFNATGGTDIGNAFITLPAGFTRFLVNAIYISNASHTLASAAVQFYSAASAGGTAYTASITPSVTATADATNNNAESCTITDATTMSYLVASEPAIYVHLITAEGAAATADVTVILTPLP